MNVRGWGGMMIVCVIVDCEDEDVKLVMEGLEILVMRSEGWKKGKGEKVSVNDEDEDGFERWKWRRVMLKVLGEVLVGEDGFGILLDVVKLIVSEVV